MGPRRRWWTLLVWQTSSALSRTTPTARERPSVLSRPSLPSLRTNSTMQMRMPFGGEELPWPNWRPVSETLRWSWEMSSQGPARTPRASRNPNAAPRNSLSRLKRTRRTRIACPTLQRSCSQRSRLTRSRLKRRRRLLPSTWQSSEKPSRSSRRQRSVQSLPRPRCVSNLTNSSQPFFNPVLILIFLLQKKNLKSVQSILNLGLFVAYVNTISALNQKIKKKKDNMLQPYMVKRKKNMAASHVVKVRTLFYNMKT